jgi:hypothetical protein
MTSHLVEGPPLLLRPLYVCPPCSSAILLGALNHQYHGDHRPSSGSTSTISCKAGGFSAYPTAVNFLIPWSCRSRCCRCCRCLRLHVPRQCSHLSRQTRVSYVTSNSTNLEALPMMCCTLTSSLRRLTQTQEAHQVSCPSEFCKLRVSYTPKLPSLQIYLPSSMCRCACPVDDIELRRNREARHVIDLRPVISSCRRRIRAYLKVYEHPRGMMVMFQCIDTLKCFQHRVVRSTRWRSHGTAADIEFSLVRL